MCTFHRNLCSVVNARTSRKCEENCKLLIEFIEIMKTVHKSLRIVGIQQIEEYIVILLHIHSIATIYHIFKLFFFHCLIKEKVMNPTKQWIIHYRIILISLKPLTCIMPYLTKQIYVWSDIF